MEPREMSRLLMKHHSDGVILSPQKISYLWDYTKCRTHSKGCQILRCDECHRSVVLYNACNRRGCPVCARKNQLAWLASAKSRLLPTAHIHLVFSFPDEVTQKWRSDPRQTIGLLFRGVNRVLRKFEKTVGLTTGRMLVFQSHARGMAYKAHIHCVMTQGGLNEQGKWVGLGTLPLAQMAEWLEQEVPWVAAKKGWQIHDTRHNLGGERVVGYLGQRQIGMVVRPDQVQSSDDKVQINDHGNQTLLPNSSFVQRYMDHVPERGTVMARNYGLYSNKKRELREIARAELGALVPEQPSARYEQQCPDCKVALKTLGFWPAYEPKSFKAWGFEGPPPEHWEFSKAC